MWTFSTKSITICLLVLLSWSIGMIELVDTLTNFSTQWFWLIIALIYTSAINDVFGHMILTHRLFAVNTNSAAYKILAFLFITDHGWGPITGFCMAHHRHHQCTDQGNKDVANWRIGWWAHGIVSPINYLYQPVTDWGDVKKYVEGQRQKFQCLFDDTYTFVIEEFSHIWTIIFWLTLYLLCPIVLFKVVMMGRLLLSILTMFSTIGGHSRIPGGYRNFDTPDLSHNNLFLHYLSFCLFPTVLQNNHHGQRYSLRQGNQHKWYEPDLSVWIARFFRLVMQKKEPA